MGGSASIQCRANNIFGHDGMMGSHGPISVGLVMVTKSLHYALPEMLQQRRIIF